MSCEEFRPSVVYAVIFTADDEGGECTRMFYKLEDAIENAEMQLDSIELKWEQKWVNCKKVWKTSEYEGIIVREYFVY